MKLLKSITVILLILAGKFSFCQQDSLRDSLMKTSNLMVGFNSSLIYPGATTGIELPITETYITKSLKSGKEKRITRSQFLTADLSWYHHPNFHDNFYLTFGWTNRRTRKKGLVTEFSPGIGYSRTFLGGTTYKVDEDGNATIEKLAGYSYALVKIGGGIGYDFSMVNSKPFMISYKLNLLTMFPYNSTIYFRPTMGVVLIYKLPHLLPVRVKINRKSK